MSFIAVSKVRPLVIAGVLTDNWPTVIHIRYLEDFVVE